MLCPCCSKLKFTDCCGLYIEGGKTPPNAEALMRSRYTAYTLADMAYISKTMRGKPALGFNQDEARDWAQNVTWVDLEVIRADGEENKAFVEFIATLIEKKKVKRIHEISEFECDQNVWIYTDGTNPENTKKITPARNSPCPCGSLKKYKNCHGK